MGDPIHCELGDCTAQAVYLLGHSYMGKDDDRPAVCVDHVAGLLSDYTPTTVYPLGTAFQTAVNHEDGKTRIDLVPYTCDAAGHTWSGVLKAGARKGRPKLGSRCICGKQAWTERRDQALNHNPDIQAQIDAQSAHTKASIAAQIKASVAAHVAEGTNG